MEEGIQKLLNELEDLIDQSRSVMFSNKVAVDRNDLFEIIQEIRAELPKEIEQSNWILNDRNRIIIEAERSADNMLQKAEEQLRYMIDEHQIVKGALDKAKEIEEESKVYARNIKKGAFEYADKLLADLETDIKSVYGIMQNGMTAVDKFYNDTLNELYENRQELRSGGASNSGKRGGKEE